MKYIYIDTNQYRHLFSANQGFSDSVYELLIKLIEKDHACLLLPQQTKDEVLRHVYGDWRSQSENSVKNQIKGLEDKINNYEKDLGKYVKWKALKQEIEKSLDSLRKELGLITKEFTNRKSPTWVKLLTLFNKAEFIEETDQIFRNAEMRMKKGNPPYNDDKIGDSLIWEILLNYTEAKKKDNSKPKLLVIGSDKKAWGDKESGFNQFLIDEYKQKTNGDLELVSKLSDLSILTENEQAKMAKEERENSKVNAINDFINSGSFLSAGTNINKLLKYKDILTFKELNAIIEASISNAQIYESFYTPSSIIELLHHENLYVTKLVEKIPFELWQKFKNKYKTELKRQCDNIEITIN